jgi:hypothetical protein
MSSTRLLPMLILLAPLAATVTGCVVREAPRPYAAPVAPAATVEIIAPRPPPAVRYEVVPPPPPQRAEVVTWDPGHWHWDGREWVWMPGHFVERPHREARWEPGHWAERPNGTWVWVNGHWL